MTDIHGWTLSCRDKGTSTSDLARAAARAGAATGSAFLLHEQTAGRGRHGRQWASKRGGMYMSVLLYPSSPVAGWFALSFATALAIYDVVERHLTEQISQHEPAARLPVIGLKWPNDVLVDGRKIAGVLLEADGNSLIIGSGINIAAIAPLDHNPHPPIGFADFPGVLPAPETLAKNYLHRLKFYYDKWEQDGFAPLRDLWLACALHMKQNVTVTVAGRKVTGICDDLALDGGLVLLDQSGASHHITTGDVELIGY
ncbi:biotin--[acetyl-CoA-carboxylase] ligase [Alphaproteobacteria bacterium]|nr:biotin--[acetyl-CoA-carboxylase] ligase [Alphaproteobacteria bacterium]